MGLLPVVLLSSLPLAVPFVPQEKDTCGAAALAMVLRYWDRAVSQDEIAGALLKPELHGIPGSRLAAFARARGLQAIAYEGDADQLRDYLNKGRPLIVAWKMGRNRYHNVVVIGFDQAKNQVLVNDPAQGPGRTVPVHTFERRWAAAGHWTLLVLPGGP